MAIHVYRHTDPGAPAHPSSTRGSMAALLRSCLVEGYFLGDDVTAPAGWEEPFTELNDYAVFRSLMGPRQFFQVDDATTDADVAYMRACETLSAVDAAPVGEWGQSYFGKQYDLGHNTEWTVIADERTCYVMLHSHYGNIIHGFGEFDSLVPNDPYNSFIAGHKEWVHLPDTTDFSYVPLVDGNIRGTSGELEVHRSCVGTFAANGSLQSFDGYSMYPGGSYNQSSVASANVGLGFYTSPMLITCDYNHENGLRLTRGKLRGIFAPQGYRPKANQEEFVDAITGQTMLSIHWGIYNTSSYWGSVHFQISGAW